MLKTFSSALIVILALSVAQASLACVDGPPGTKAAHMGHQLEVKENFGSKLVYEGHGSDDPEAYREDCEARGGQFNECGSPCNDKAQGCIAMCAYTCESIQAQQ